MTYRALISAVAVLAALAACENKPAEAPKATTEAKVTAPAATPATPAQTGAVADTQQAATKAMKPACTNSGGNDCRIEVSVAGDPCKITKTPDVKHVLKNSKNAKLTWEMQAGSTWDFDTNGIDFSPKGTSVFSCKAAGKGKYECMDKNDDAKPEDYPYTVKVKDTSSSKTCTADPMIVNGADATNAE